MGDSLKQSPQSTGNQDASSQEQIWSNIIKQQEQYQNQQNQQARSAAASLGTYNSGYAGAGASRPALGGVQATQNVGAPPAINPAQATPPSADATSTPQAPAAGATAMQQPAQPSGPTGIGAQMAALGSTAPQANPMGSLASGFAAGYRPKPKKQPQPAQPVQTAMNGPS
jgi:hypothetical protein